VRLEEPEGRPDAAAPSAWAVYAGGTVPPDARRGGNNWRWTTGRLVERRATSRDAKVDGHDSSPAAQGSSSLHQEHGDGFLEAVQLESWCCVGQTPAAPATVVPDVHHGRGPTGRTAREYIGRSLYVDSSATTAGVRPVGAVEHLGHHLVQQDPAGEVAADRTVLHREVRQTRPSTINAALAAGKTLAGHPGRLPPLNADADSITITPSRHRGAGSRPWPPSCRTAASPRCQHLGRRRASARRCAHRRGHTTNSQTLVQIGASGSSVDFRPRGRPEPC